MSTEARKPKKKGPRLKLTPEQRKERKRRQQYQWDADNRLLASEVPEIPKRKDWRRRAACGKSLELFLTTYFPHSTGLSPLSDDHRRVIGRMEICLRNGGRQANCVYRGFAKTTITENAALWAALYGYRRCILLLGASDPAATLMMESIKSELQTNDLLREDFPEVCFPIEKLDNKPQRCAAQVYRPTGKLTHIRFTSSYVVLPTTGVDWGRSDGTVILTRGITAAARGISIKHPTGEKLRPDFAIVDDPQTDDSAKSETEVAARLSIIRRGILKSASHQTSMACVVNGTVIRPHDVMDQLCDREENPAWESERVPMVKKWADEHDTLWNEYRQLRHNFDPEEVGDRLRAHEAATAFYVENREEMDEGCSVSWPSCFDPDVEKSAIQHAYNLFFDDPPDVFETECQQNAGNPLDDGEGPKVLPAKELIKQVNGLDRGIMPNDRDKVTAFIDVHDRLLFWSVCGWTEDGFAGDVISYGAWPKQPSFYGWTLRNCPRPISRAYPGKPRLQALEAALDDCIDHLMGQKYHRPDGAEFELSRLLVDAGYEPGTVELSIRKSPYAALIDPARGRGIGAKDKPMRLYTKKPGELLQAHWRKFRPQKRTRMWVEADVNYWKGFIHDQFCDGSLRLFGNQPEMHRMIAAHLTAEQPAHIVSQTHGREVDEWSLIHKGLDNHLLDCVVGCAVGAAMSGCETSRDASAPERAAQAQVAAQWDAFLSRGR